jgi:hypothetical protein
MTSLKLPQKICPSCNRDAQRAQQRQSKEEYVQYIINEQADEMTRKTTLNRVFMATKKGLLRKMQSNLLCDRHVGQERKLYEEQISKISKSIDFSKPTSSIK